MPDETFRPLDDGAVPALAPAWSVRARGDQRRARTRVAFAGASVAAVGLAFAGGYALVGVQRTDALRPPPAASSPAPEASPEVTPSGRPSEQASSPAPRSPSPTTAPTTSPPAASPSAAAPRAYDPAAAVLTVQDATRVEPGAWADATTDDDGPLLDPCPGGTAYPRDADRVARTATGLTSTREAGGTDLRQTVARYSSVRAAGDAFDGYGRAVRGCPSRPVAEGPAGSTLAHELVQTSGTGTQRTALFRRVNDCPEVCSVGYEYVAVQQVDDAVGVLAFGYGEDGDPGVGAVRPFAAVAAERLAAVVRG